MAGCLFCRIASGDIPANVAWSDDSFVAFHDLNPQAPVHVLVIPREHVASVNDLRDEHGGTLGRLFVAARDLAKTLGIADGGYRLVVNVGANGGQSVGHLHLHLLGGRQMTWPPG